MYLLHPCTNIKPTNGIATGKWKNIPFYSFQCFVNIIGETVAGIPHCQQQQNPARNSNTISNISLLKSTNKRIVKLIITPT